MTEMLTQTELIKRLLLAGVIGGLVGAGAIMRNPRGSVHGVTTAASVWVNAALGMSAGAGLYALAIIGSAITLAVLAILGRIENAVEHDGGAKRR